jgi:hypothetical protein
MDAIGKQLIGIAVLVVVVIVQHTIHILNRLIPPAIAVLHNRVPIKFRMRFFLKIM